MKKQEVVRDYKFADSTLVTVSLEKVAFMARDQANFLNFGIDNAEIMALKVQTNDFADTSTDTEALGDQTQATVDKDAYADGVRVAIREVMSRVVLTFGEGSPKYKKFGTDTLSRQTDSELLITGKRVVRVGTELLADLTANGLTALMLTNITVLTDKFTDKIIDVQVEIGTRDINQEDRVEAGNLIYQVLAKYCKVGRSMWETTDVAKYNDYIIYNTKSGGPEEATPPTV